MKRTTRIAWLLFVFCVVSAVAAQVARWLTEPRAISASNLVQSLGWDLVLPLSYACIAALIIARQPRNRVGGLLMLVAITTSLPLSGFLVVPRFIMTPQLYLLLWLENWGWIPMIFPVFLIPLHFPTGRPPSPRWRWINWLALGMWLFFILFTPFLLPEIGPTNGAWLIDNPLHVTSASSLEAPFLSLWSLGLMTLVAGSVTSLFVRYRRADSEERLQIRWLLFAGVLLLVIYIVTLALSPNDSDLPIVVNLLLLLSILGIGVAIGVAILRYHVYDIDLIIRKTLSYALLTVLLALVYFGSVILMQAAFETTTGSRSSIAIVISTLLIAALFTPLRRRLQTAIDRRFFRQKYDSQQLLAQFARVVQDETDMAQLTIAINTVVQDALQPDQTSILINESDHR